MTCPSCLVTNKTQAPVTLSKHGLTPRPTPTPERPRPSFPKWGKGRLVSVSSQPPCLPASLFLETSANSLAFEKRRKRHPFSRP